MVHVFGFLYIFGALNCNAKFYKPKTDINIDFTILEVQGLPLHYFLNSTHLDPGIGQEGNSTPRA